MYCELSPDNVSHIFYLVIGISVNRNAREGKGVAVGFLFCIKFHSTFFALVYFKRFLADF